MKSIRKLEKFLNKKVFQEILIRKFKNLREKSSKIESKTIYLGQQSSITWKFSL